MRDFIEIAGFSQIVMRAERFAKEMFAKDEVVRIDAFPSLKAALYTAFHKFYADKTRRPSRFDAFDIVISHAIPYVDAVITENHQAEVIRKTKRLDQFIHELEPFP